jgi:predicted NAD/FAD-binding protein
LNAPVLAVRRAHTPDGGTQVWVTSHRGDEVFDDVVLACHTDQSLALLQEASVQERQWLQSIRYHRNQAVLHTDASVLPRRRLAWAAWNYERAAQPSREEAGVCLHYLINRLQPLPWQRPVVVSLNPHRPIDASQVVARIDYDHPVFDREAVSAQARIDEFQGRGGVWFCGAWTRYGFHEDGLRSGLDVVQRLKASWGATA